MPDTGSLSISPRRFTSSSRGTSAHSSCHGDPVARRTPGPRRSWIAAILEALGLGTVTCSEGAYLCPQCLSVYNDINDHVCIYTGVCLECNRREVLHEGACSVCGGREYVLARRGM